MTSSTSHDVTSVMGVEATQTAAGTVADHLVANHSHAVAYSDTVTKSLDDSVNRTESATLATGTVSDVFRLDEVTTIDNISPRPSEALTTNNMNSTALNTTFQQGSTGAVTATVTNGAAAALQRSTISGAGNATGPYAAQVQSTFAVTTNPNSQNATVLGNNNGTASSFFRTDDVTANPITTAVGNGSAAAVDGTVAAMTQTVSVSSTNASFQTTTATASSDSRAPTGVVTDKTLKPPTNQTPLPQDTTNSGLLTTQSYATKPNQVTGSNFTSLAPTRATAGALPQGPTILGLEAWLFGVIVGGAALVLLLIVIAISCMVKKKRRQRARDLESRNVGWIDQQQGQHANIVLTDVRRNDNRFSQQSVDDKVTAIGNEGVVNVFDADNEAFAPSPVIARLAVVRGDPTSNGVNQDGVAHNEFSPPLKAGTPKKGKTLTKVSTPTIGNEPEKIEKIAPKESTLAEEEKEAGSDGSSVFGSKSNIPLQVTPAPSMESFKSPGSTSSPGLSPAHQQLTSDGKTALMPSPEEQATLPTPPPPPSAATPSHDAAANATSQSSIPPPPPMPTDVTGSPIPDLSRNDRQKSFLHAAKNSDSTAPAESSSNIPPPPPL